jgi:hypothetical protein
MDLGWFEDSGVEFVARSSPVLADAGGSEPCHGAYAGSVHPASGLPGLSAAGTGDSTRTVARQFDSESERLRRFQKLRVQKTQLRAA